jgi:hypothetical protein
MAICEKQTGHSVVSVRSSGRDGQRLLIPLEPTDGLGDGLGGVEGAGKPEVEDMAPILAEQQPAEARFRDWGTKGDDVEKNRWR